MFRVPDMNETPYSQTIHPADDMYRDPDHYWAVGESAMDWIKLAVDRRQML